MGGQDAGETERRLSSVVARASVRCRWAPLSLARRGVVRHLAGHSKWVNIRKKKGGLDAKVAGHKNVNDWRAGITWTKDKEAELIALHKLFKACGGGKELKIPRAKFLKNFTTKVEMNGEPVTAADAQSLTALFNSASIDYDYESFSLHECVHP